MSHARSGLTRRESLKLGFVSAAAATGMAGPALVRSSAAASNGQAGNGQRPRNVIFMVSDGMSAGTLTLTDTFARLMRGSDYNSHWARLFQRPDAMHGLEETYSLDSLVTDSAAAAAAWGSGSRQTNGTLNKLPDGTELTTLAELAQDKGKRVGLVTTTQLTHATPAGFATVADHRGMQEEIAPQYLDRVDVLLGGGRNHFHPDHRDDGRDLIGEFEQSGYTYWNHRDQLVNGSRPGKILGAFSGGGHLPYTVDQRESDSLRESVPTLAEMTGAALESLNQHDDGFFMMVEGGRVDHAAHGTDTGGLLWDQLAFDDAIGVAMAFAEEHGDTLVVITTDHANANPGLNSHGGSTNANFERTAGIKGSNGTILNAIRGAANDASDPDAATVVDVVQELTGVQIREDHAELVATTIRDGENPHELNLQLNHFNGALAQALGNHTGIQWIGRSHTSDYVVASAFGPGAERFAGLRPNYDDFHQIADLWEIDHRNPTADPDEVYLDVLQTSPRSVEA